MIAATASLTFDSVVHESLANQTQPVTQPVHPAVVYGVVEEWHRSTHVGRFAHCSEQPCHAIHLRTATTEIHAALSQGRR